MARRYNANLEVQYPETSLLGQIGEATRKALKDVWRENRYEAGQIILGAEESSRDVLFLLEGAVRVANFSAKGREVSFSAIDEGDCFGEFAVLDGAPRSASVVALAPCHIARVGEAQFLQLLNDRSDICIALMRSLVDKLRDLTRRVSDLTAMKADDRIRQELLRLARDASPSDTAEALLETPPTQAELATIVFTNREAVAREIGRMKRKGLIERRGRGLFVPSIPKLEAYVIEAQSI